MARVGPVDVTGDDPALQAVDEHVVETGRNADGERWRLDADSPEIFIHHPHARDFLAVHGVSPERTVRPGRRTR